MYSVCKGNYMTNIFRLYTCIEIFMYEEICSTTYINHVIVYLKSIFFTTMYQVIVKVKNGVLFAVDVILNHIFLCSTNVISLQFIK